MELSQALQAARAEADTLKRANIELEDELKVSQFNQIASLSFINDLCSGTKPTKN